MLSIWIPSASLVVLLSLALWQDVCSRRIQNGLVLAGLLVGVACNIFSLNGPAMFGVGGIGLSNSLLGALSGLTIMLPLYFLRAMGGGDVKLMAAIGAFLGPMQVFGAALLTFVSGGMLSLIAALWSGSFSRVLGNLRLMSMVAMSGRSTGLSLKDVQTTGRLPYAIAITIGTGLQVWLAARGGWVFV